MTSLLAPAQSSPDCSLYEFVRQRRRSAAVFSNQRQLPRFPRESPDSDQPFFVVEDISGLEFTNSLGGHGPETLNGLKWIRDAVAPALSAVLEREGPIDLASLMAQAFTMGDEMHQRNVACSSLLLRQLAPLLARTSKDAGELVACLEFVPYLGALTAVAVFTLAGLSAFEDVGHALLIPGAFLAINLIQANFVTPMLLGHRLTLNPVAIFIGLTSGLAYLLLGRALRPVDEIVRLAERITSQNLSQRLPIRDTGDEIERLTQTPSFEAGAAMTWSPSPRRARWAETRNLLEGLIARGLLQRN